jgi:predicted DNA-binding transcriptional regulator YafY
VKDHHIAKRYRLIELLSYWQGHVNSTQLSQHFAVSTTQGKKYFAGYQLAYPKNLRYDNRLKGYVPQPDFAPTYITGDASEYLQWLDHPSETVTAKKVASLTNTSLNLPQRHVLPDVMRGLVAAIKSKRRLEVNYISLSNPNGQGRIIQPHVFVRTGLRWHLRAFDEKHQQFRDFVLSRFQGQPELLDGATHSANEDQAWQTHIELELTPDSRFSAKQKTVIEQDYNMQNGTLILKTRAALAQYLLQEMQVNFKFLDAKAEAQQLVLANKNAIKQWLFNG